MTASHDNAGIAASNYLKTVGGAVIHSYADCVKFLDGQPLKQVASNVVIENHYEYISVVLYRTEIVRYYPDETFSVDNGGFNTLTTSTRVNQFTPDGYFFGHTNKKLLANGKPTGHNVRFPVVKP